MRQKLRPKTFGEQNQVFLTQKPFWSKALPFGSTAKPSEEKKSSLSETELKCSSSKSQVLLEQKPSLSVAKPSFSGADARQLMRLQTRSIVSADKVSAAKTSVMAADETSVVSQDIPMVLQRRQRSRDGNGIGMSREITNVLAADATDVVAADTTDVLSADMTQNMPSLRTKHMSFVQAHQKSEQKH